MKKEPKHNPTNVTDQGVILEIKLQEKKIGLPALLQDTMKPETYERFVDYMKKNNPNGKKHK